MADTAVLDTAMRDTSKADSNRDQLSDLIKSLSADSQWMDVKHNVTHLFQDAKVMYGSFELSADYIRMDNNTGIIFASGMKDQNGKYKGRPIFKTATDPPTTVDSLFYNIKSRKAKVFGVHTDEDGSYINARELKKNQYDEVFIHNALYTTCDLPYPHTHFGIFITKGVVTENRIIAGPSYLVIENVPIPFIAIPFGFFPKTNKRASGLIFPSFGEDGTKGFFMRDVGWYFGINDYWDAKLTGSLYSKGSYDGALAVQYQKRYRYNGNLNFRYGYTKLGEEGTPDFSRNKDFNFTWSHSQSQEANPGTTFSASVNLGTSSYFNNTAAGLSYNYDQLTSNNMSSNISYGKTFGDGRFNLTATLGHRQDIPARIPNSTLPQPKGTIYLELPTFRLSMQSFNPFDSKDRIGDQKWYQRITVGYTLDVKNSIQTTEDSLFKKDALKKFQNGVQHTIPVSLSLNVLKYFQFNSSVNYTERWYLQTTRLALDNSPAGYVQRIDTVNGFTRAYNYSLSTGLSTKVYGMYGKIGKMQALRHVITPSINFNYTPDFANPRYGFYRDFITPGGDTTQYSIFRNNVFGGPGSGRSMGIGFSVDNNIEAKFLSKTDTSNGGFKKVPILQGLSFSGNYNFVADSMKLSTIGFSGRTALFDQKMGINFGGSLDPYALDSTGRRINRYMIKEGKLARLTNFNLSFSYSFNADAAKSRNDNLNELDEQKPKMTDEQRRALERISTDPNAFVDFKIPWNISASFSFNYSKPGYVSQVTSTLNISGDFNVTDNWKVTYNSGYDFRAKKTTLTQFNIYRDLHDFNMTFGWIPFGGYKSFTFTIRAKASVLRDLKLDKRSDYYNSF